MSIRFKPLITASMLLPAFSVVLANMATGSPVTADSWQGTWRDKDGGIIAVTHKSGVLDVAGTDRASIYRCVCILDPKDLTAATCSGDGVNFAKGFRFAYRNRLELGRNGALVEKWEAMSSEGSIQGVATFTRVLEAAR